MNADISDILASVSAPQLPQRALDLQALTRAWINERSAPELLPYPTDLISRCNEGVQSQIGLIEAMAGEMDPGANFTLVIIRTELERVKFLIRSFLRTRLAKIDKFPLHYQRLHLEAQPDSHVLSELESKYLHEHQVLLERHYKHSFLDLFPKFLQTLDDAGGTVSMVDKPDQDTAVFCRVLRNTEVERPQRMDLIRGEIWVLRWSSVKEQVERGDVELI